jgi:hypothetical protein
LIKRERRECGMGVIERHFNLKGNKTYSRFLPSFQAETVRFQVEIHLREGKALGSEESRGLGGGLLYGQRIKIE